eukprot:g4327.t1
MTSSPKNSGMLVSKNSGTPLGFKASSYSQSHCIILAAGIANPPISPYTQVMPKCFVPVAGEPILHHILKMFVSQNIKKFTVVIGAHAEYFSPEVKEGLQKLVGGAPGAAASRSRDSSSSNKSSAEKTIGGTMTNGKNGVATTSGRAGPTNKTSSTNCTSNITFVENRLFWNNGPADSLKLGFNSMKQTDPAAKTVYVCYGDVVFTEVALQKLFQFPAPNALLIDRAVLTMDLRGAKSRETGLQELELCSVVALGERGGTSNGGGRSRFTEEQVRKHEALNLPPSSLLVDCIGKNLGQNRSVEAYGEFTGLFRAETNVLQRACGLALETHGGAADYVPAPRAASGTGTTGSGDHGSPGAQNLVAHAYDTGVVSEDRYVPDLLRKCIPGDFFAVPIFGNRREIHSSQDLLQANSELCYLSDQTGRRAYIRAIGARLLAEANDLKRPVEIIAQELNFPEGVLDDLLSGNIELETAQEILRKVNTNYPVSLNALWVEPDDCQNGIRICRAKQSEVSKRILNRLNGKTGFRTPYYEYRDCAMSRLGPFRPEWIRELRVVSDSDANNPEVAFNNGHLLFQSTFFIGPVNFYYSEPDGTKRCVEMNTGDSNWIAPFVPHSFTNRDESQFACIIACTYGSNIVNSLQTIGGLHPQLHGYSGDLRDARSHFLANLLRYATNDGFADLKGLAESILQRQRARQEGGKGTSSSASGSDEESVVRLMEEVLGIVECEGADGETIFVALEEDTAAAHEIGVKKSRATGAPFRVATLEECCLLAAELCCQPEDLFVSGGLTTPVEVSHRGQGAVRKHIGVTYERLASSEHHSMIKSFDVEVVVALGEKGKDIPYVQISVHTFGYNYSGVPCTLELSCEQEASMAGAGESSSSEEDVADATTGNRSGSGMKVKTRKILKDIQPGDSFYIQPNVRHRFIRDHGAAPGQDEAVESARLYLVRIPGGLTRELMREVALCDQRGKGRIGNESRRWYS